VLIEVGIGGLALDEKSKSPVVLLQEVGGERYLHIWIGPAEASAIAMELAGRKFPRPLTHDLMAMMVDGLKAQVSKVVISELKDNTFFAKIILGTQSEDVAIDARPSDSIALALRTHSPIYVAEELLNGQGKVNTEKTKEEREADRAEELRRFLEKMSPEDFGKFF
jgi:bifunctional DNase/RNase